jgi:hypothetical protein
MPERASESWRESSIQSGRNTDNRDEEMLRIHDDMVAGDQ